MNEYEEEILHADWEKAIEVATQMDEPIKGLDGIVENLTDTANELYGTFEFDRIISIIDDIENLRIELKTIQKKMRREKWRRGGEE